MSSETGYGVRRMAPFDRGDAAPARIKNHPTEESAGVEVWSEGVRRMAPFSKGEEAPARIKNHPSE